MAQPSRTFGLVGSAIATVIAFAILVALGTWQMQRKAWKEGLLQQISERVKAPPVPVAAIMSNLTATLPEEYDPEYRHVTVTGRFLHDKEQYVWTPNPAAGMGYHVYTPLQLADGSVLWVNRGFVVDAQKDPQSRAPGQAAGDATVTGLVRKPAVPSTFTPDNEPSKRLYYWRSLYEMQAAAFGAEGPRPLPFFVDADAEPANPGGAPRGGVTPIDLPNRHLEYALTWYGLAGTLLAVYAAFAWTRIRRANAAPTASENR